MSEQATPSELHSYEEFWPHYVRQHLHPVNRALHFIGTSLAMRLGIKAVRQRRLAPLLLAPVVGYGFAWVGHFFFEHNRPASFSYPKWSLRADFRMWKRILQRKMGEDIDLAAKNP